MSINKAELEALYDLSDNLASKSKNLKFLSIGLFVLFFSVMPVIYLHEFKKAAKASTPEAILTKYVDTLHTKKIIISDFDLVKDKVIQLCHSFNENSPDDAIQYYADTLERFYLEENISKEEVKKAIIRHAARFPDSDVKFNTNEIFISKNKDKYLVYLEVMYRKYKDSDRFKVLYELKLNKDYQVIYLRNYISRRKNNMEIDSINNLFQILNPHDDVILKIDTSIWEH